MKVLPPQRLLLLVVCCASWSSGVLIAQTSPNGTFKIESTTKDEATGETKVSDFVVSIADPKNKELLNEHPDTTSASYYISPDEKWIFDQAGYGSRMGGAQLFKRVEGLKFEGTAQLDELAWRFFAKQEKIEPAKVPFLENGIGLIDFVAWSPDSARLLVALHGGDFDENDRNRGVYLWYVYFNTRSEKLELTDYLRRLNKEAWKRFANDKLRANFGEAASAEPLGELPPEAESKKRYEAADRSVKELFEKLVAMQEKQLQQSIDDDQASETQREIYKEQLKGSRVLQRTWIKTREIGSKLYADSGPKSTATRRYWQYMAESTEACATALKEQVEGVEH
jgi:hypothetical protein